MKTNLHHLLSKNQEEYINKKFNKKTVVSSNTLVADKVTDGLNLQEDISEATDTDDSTIDMPFDNTLGKVSVMRQTIIKNTAVYCKYLFNMTTRPIRKFMDTKFYPWTDKFLSSDF